VLDGLVRPGPVELGGVVEEAARERLPNGDVVVVAAAGDVRRRTAADSAADLRDQIELDIG
jgi:hypothetical protein